MKTSTFKLGFYLKPFFIILLFVLRYTFSGAQTISTIAGNDSSGYTGDGGPATAAELFQPIGIALDIPANIYIADSKNRVIRKINTARIITTFAGNGIKGFSGDGGPATSAEMGYPVDIAFDVIGNAYIVDADKERIRMVNTSGIISTFAGIGVQGYSGDGGPATAAELNLTGLSVAIDLSGNVYIADTQRVRKINTFGIISTIAGNGIGGFSGDAGQATAAELNTPDGLAVDASGNIYIADFLNNRIRKINSSGIISTIAGNGQAAFGGDGGQATAAELYGPGGLSQDMVGNLYIADQINNRIRVINTSGVINTIAGNGVAGFSGDGGSPLSAELGFPNGQVIDNSGNVFIADLANNRIREIEITVNTGYLKNPETVSVYPNPAKESIFIQVNGTVRAEKLEIYNLEGQKILENTVERLQNMEVSTKELTNEIYFLRIYLTDGSNVVRKIVINK